MSGIANRTVKKIAIIIGALGGALLLFLLLAPALAWDGGTVVELRFQLARSGTLPLPIAGAKVRVVRQDQLYMLSDTNFAELFEPVVTDGKGLASVTIQCPAGGSQGLLGKTGNFRITHELFVEAPGYRPISTPLANVLGGRRWPLRKKTFEIPLYLTENKGT